MRTALFTIFISLAIAANAHAQPAFVPDTKAQDEKLLRKVPLSVEGPALLEYLRRRTYPEADPAIVSGLIGRLGAEEFQQREQAQAKLLSLGATALVGLRQADKHSDAEIRSRAEGLRQQIEAEANPEIQAATARLIGLTKPKDATEVLLNYLPFAADRYVTDEICKSLAAVGVDKGKPDPLLSKALSDRLPIKRAAAAEALIRGNAQGELPAVRKLLSDSDASVRLRVVLNLVRSKEQRKDDLPSLIDTFAHLSPEELWPAEEILVRLAGDKTPSISLGTNEVSRLACRDAWAKWWEQNKDGIRLDDLDKTPPFLGHTLVVQQTLTRVNNGKLIRATGKVAELNADRKEIWSFDVPTYPVDVELVSPTRVLIAEFQGRKIAEYDFQGKAHWEQSLNGNPIGVQRLPNGNTFVVMQNRLEEFSRDNKRVWEYANPNGSIFRARKTMNGEVIFVTNDGNLSRLDPQTSKVLASFNVGRVPTLFGNIDVLPNGNVLVPLYADNRVVEFDRNGRQVGQFNVNNPSSACRLPNGNTLVASQSSRQIIEFDRDGRQRWSHNADGMVFNAKAR